MNTELDDMLALMEDLYPLTRSITGEGVRATLRRVAEIAAIEIHEVASGTEVLDWEVPPEWTLRDAFIRDSEGRKVVDVAASNLHVVSYSAPVDATLPLDELRDHLHSDPERPDLIPYRTGYYAGDWGFCLSDRQLRSLPEGNYEVFIDSSLTPGSLSYGEVSLPGADDQTVLIYTHTCHPSLANDNLTGIAVAACLARWLAEKSSRRYSYRIVFGPGTIGSITWLALNREVVQTIRHGLVIGLLGDGAALQYKQSRSGDQEIDRVAASTLSAIAPGHTIIPYSPWGYDERQFGSPGFSLPVGRLTRSAEEGYPEYHSSADNLDIIVPENLAASLDAVKDMVNVLENNRRFRNLAPYGEPQLGRRGIYRQIGGAASPELQQAILWVLNLSDGKHDLADVYSKSRLPFAVILRAVELLIEAGLLEALD